MALIICPDCGNSISGRAEHCLFCGLPAKYFGESSHINKTPVNEGKKISLDMSALRNVIISFNHSYQSFFRNGHYITAHEIAGMKESFGVWAKKLGKKPAYDYCVQNAPAFAVDTEDVNRCLRRYETLDEDAKNHNESYIDEIVNDNNEYFDSMLKSIDPNIKLDTEQRRAVAADDNYCLLVAGAGAGKTTTMAAKVKYLVDKKNVPPEEIIVISYTKKAVGELAERINKQLKIPASVCTFHRFAYSIVKKFNSVPPEVNYSAYNIIFDMLEKGIFNNREFLKKVLLFLGYYFDIPSDAMEYENLNQYHLAKAAQHYETLKSGAGEYVSKVSKQRGRTNRTLEGEYLRSAQEAQIANFLYLNGLDYVYEPVYPFAIRGARKKIYTGFYHQAGRT
jgi:DNA helicase-4